MGKETRTLFVIVLYTRKYIRLTFKLFDVWPVRLLKKAILVPEMLHVRLSVRVRMKLTTIATRKRRERRTIGFKTTFVLNKNKTIYDKEIPTRRVFSFWSVDTRLAKYIHMNMPHEYDTVA